MASPVLGPDAAFASRYVIERELGRGGMATVWLARDEKHGRQVALKLLRPELAAAVGEERFLLEICTAARLNHPHILALHDSGAVDGQLYYTMPFVPGETLRDRLRRDRELPVEEALRIACQVATALDHAHRQGIVHRDIKPENVLLHEGEALVADFGIALVVNAASEERITATGLALGTPQYMSLEQAAGERAVDGRSDIYSLGCVLYEMLTGDPPFTGSRPDAILARKATQPVPPLRGVRDTVSEDVEQIVRKALARSPADRFASAGDFSEALRTAMADAAATTRGSGSGARRRRLAVIASLATALAVIGLAAFVGIAQRWRPAGSVPVRSIVVIPFDNLSGDRGEEYFVDGMHEAVIGELASLDALRVVSRTSAMRYRGSGRPASEIARALEVDAAMEGSVLRVADRVRIALQLVDVRTDEHIWTGRYERDLDDVLALQSEIARAVANEIDLVVSPAEGNGNGHGPEGPSTRRPDPAAYDAYLKGRWSLRRWPAAGATEDAVREFERAVAIDPAFALAQAALAEATYVESLGLKSFERGRAAALRAVELAPDLPDAQMALGLVHMRAWEWREAEEAFRQAIALDPGSMRAHMWYAMLLRYTSRPEAAMQELRAALDLDPVSLLYQSMMGWVLFDQRRYDEAIRTYDRVLALDPDFGLAFYNKGLAYAMMGEGEKVVAMARLAASNSGGELWETQSTWLLGVGYALTGEREEAKRILHQLEKRTDVTFGHGLAATLHLFLGDRDAAFEWLERGVRTVPRDMSIPNTVAQPWFHAARDDPRWRKLKEELGVP